MILLGDYLENTRLKTGIESTVDVIDVARPKIYENFVLLGET